MPDGLSTLCRRDWLRELPEEMLWRIMGYLDLQTLCTARLVCKLFRNSASGHLKALQIDSKDLEQAPPSGLTQLSGLTHLAVSVSGKRRLRVLTHPRIAPLVTHVELHRACFEDMQGGIGGLSHLVSLPNLSSLVMALPVGSCEIVSLPVRLKELHIKHFVQKDASSLTRFSGLTKLRVDLLPGAEQSLETLTSLHSLRSLELSCGASALRTLSTFTMLTSLTWNVGFDSFAGNVLHGLSHLIGLSRLDVIDHHGIVTHEHLACLSGLTRLTCFGLAGSRLADNVAGSSALMPLTRLASLRLLGLPNGLLLLPTLNVGALHSLELSWVEGDISALQRATGLTHLDFHFIHVDSFLGLEAILVRMSKLHSLSLNVEAGHGH